MTQQVSLADLSRLLDGEVTAEEKRDLESRLANCSISQTLFARLRTLNKVIGGATIRKGLKTAATVEATKPSHSEAGCLSDAILIGLADNTLSETLRAKVEAHILHCNHCLARVLADLRTAASMRANTWAQVPAALRQKMSPHSTTQPTTTPEPQEEEWQTVKISLTAPKIQPVECAYGQINLRFEAVAVDDSHLRLALTIQVGGQARAGQVFVVINSATRQKIATNCSDARGRLTITRLTTGSFNIHVQGTPLRVELTISA